MGGLILNVDIKKILCLSHGMLSAYIKFKHEKAKICTNGNLHAMHVWLLSVEWEGKGSEKIIIKSYGNVGKQWT